MQGHSPTEAASLVEVLRFARRCIAPPTCTRAPQQSTGLLLSLRDWPFRISTQIKNHSHAMRKDIFVITQHYRFFISADYLLPDMELQQKEQLQTQDQHEHADHQKRYVHQKQKAHPAYLLPQGKTPHQYGHSIFAGF